MDPIILCKNLTRRYGDLVAVNDVSFSVPRAQCFGLLGPNGAGKSTLIRMLYGARIRDGGDLKVFEYDPSIQSRQIKRRLGVVPQENCLDDDLSVYDNLRLFGLYHGLQGQEFEKKLSELLEFMSLDTKTNQEVKALSGGMQRRLAFVRALLHDPEILILDEPTTGLDPAVRHLLWDRVHELSLRGVTVILTTHYMEEAQKLCSNLVIMDEGRLKVEGSPQRLIEESCPGYVALFERKAFSAEQLKQLESDSSLEVFVEPLQIHIQAESMERLNQISTSFSTRPIMIRPTNLEDVFLKITGKELQENA